MNTDRESQCIKYERDDGTTTEPNSAARGGYKESAYRKGLEIGPFQKRVSDYRERLKVVDVRDDCCKCAVSDYRERLKVVDVRDDWPWQAGQATVSWFSCHVIYLFFVTTCTQLQQSSLTSTTLSLSR